MYNYICPPASSSPPLAGRRHADPLRLQGAEVVGHVKVALLDPAQVDHVHHVIDGDAGLSDVGCYDDLADARRGSLKHLHRVCVKG